MLFRTIGQQLIVISLFSLLAAACKADSSDIHIVAFGTSFTAGKGVGTSEVFTAKLEKLLKEKGEHVQIINRGTNGITTTLLLSSVGSAVPDNTQIVIFEYAYGNDKSRGISIDEMVKNCDAIIGKLVARNIQVLLVIRGRDQDELVKRIGWFHETIAKYKIRYIAIEQPESSLQFDKQHPTAEAHGLIAASMVDSVMALIGVVKESNH